jgi:hypothetical protein
MRRTLTRIQSMDAQARATELLGRYDAELGSLIPDGSVVFDAHLHLGHDIDGMVGDYDELEALMVLRTTARSPTARGAADG